MYFYILLFAFVFCFSFCCSYSKDYSLGICLKTICFLLLFLPAAIRFNIGTDYPNYVRGFYRYRNGLNAGKEIGWNFLYNILIKFNLNEQWLFILSSLIMYIVLVKTSKKDLWGVISIYVLYLYTTSYNQVRNAISICLFWYSYVCVCKEKKIESTIYLVLSCLFHSSAFVYIPVFICMNFIKLNRNFTLVLAIAGYVLITRMHMASRILNSPLFANFSYARYLTYNNYGREVVLGSGLGVLLRIMYTVLCFLLCDRNKCSKSEYNAMSWLFLCVLYTDCMSTQIFIFQRLVVCFYIAYMAMFSIMVRNNWKSYKSVFILFCFAYAFYFVFYYGLTHNYNECIPYTSIFNKYAY